MATSLIILIALSCAAFVFGQKSVCKFRDPCRCHFSNGSVIDLSTVGTKGPSPRFIFVPVTRNSTVPKKIDAKEKDEAEVSLFSYNPCIPFTQNIPGVKPGDREEPCINVAACKLTSASKGGGAPEMHALGIQQSATFFMDNDQNMFVGYNTPHGKSNLTVRLVCNKTVDYELTVWPLSVPDQYNMNLTSRCACPDENGCITADPPSEKPGLSPGSILLIIFFTLLLAYVALGITVNFCNGAKGIELLPNIGFWSDLPHLITDGFLYTCTCFRSRERSSYSDL